jgi:hypothetical protein
MKETKVKYNLRAHLLPDSQMSAARAFRIAYEVNQETLAKLKSHRVDLEAASGEKHQRLDPQLLLAALRTLGK